MINNDLENNIISQKRLFSNRCKIILCIILIVFAGIIFTILFSSSEAAILDELNTKNYDNYVELIPIGRKLYHEEFTIDWDDDTCTPNYVSYIMPETTSGNTGGDWIVDPELNERCSGLPTKYHGGAAGYDMGHLVENKVFGSITYINTNAVPMLANFNRGAWNGVESRLRRNAKNMLIVKGPAYGFNAKCLNNGEVTQCSSQYSFNLYIPGGIYYAVINQSINTLTDYGYYENIVGSKCIDQFPPFLLYNGNVGIDACKT